MADEIPPSFNMVKATFLLVAAVFTAYGFGALVGEFACMYGKLNGIATVDNCGKNVSDVFGALLAAALAYAAGHSSGGAAK